MVHQADDSPDRTLPHLWPGISPHPELDPEKIAQTDPQNKWLHRMPVRRLQAEAIRDALLAVSGKLNAQGLRARRAHSPYRFYDRAWISAQRPSRRTWP